MLHVLMRGLLFSLAVCQAEDITQEPCVRDSASCDENNVFGGSAMLQRTGHSVAIVAKAATDRNAPVVDLCAQPINNDASISGKTASLDEEGYRSVARTHSQSRMRDFIERVLQDMGKIITNEGSFLGFLPFFDCERSAMSYEQLQQEIHRESEGPNPAFSSQAWKSKRLANGSVVTEKVDLCSDALKIEPRPTLTGGVAPLSEDGYRAVARMHSPENMREFVVRVLQSMGKAVVNEGSFSGFLPYFDCTTAGMTFKELQDAIEQETARPNAAFATATSDTQVTRDAFAPATTYEADAGATMVEKTPDQAVAAAAQVTPAPAAAQVTPAPDHAVAAAPQVTPAPDHGVAAAAQVTPAPDHAHASTSKAYSSLAGAGICADPLPQDPRISGNVVPLNELGYQAVARQRNPAVMKDFMRRVLHEMGMSVKYEEGFKNVLPDYDCEKGARSLKDLQDHFKWDAASPNPWISGAEATPVLIQANAEIYHTFGKHHNKTHDDTMLLNVGSTDKTSRSNDGSMMLILFSQHPGFFSDGYTLHEDDMTVPEAMKQCLSYNGSCSGFYHSGPPTDGKVHVIFKGNATTIDTTPWTSYKKEADDVTSNETSLFSLHNGLVSGEDLSVQRMTVEEAKRKCLELAEACAGFSHAGPSSDEAVAVFFKRTWALAPPDTWTAYKFQANVSNESWIDHLR